MCPAYFTTEKEMVMRKMIAVATAVAYLVGALPVYAEGAKTYLASTLKEGQTKSKKIDPRKGECVVHITEEREVALETPTGMVEGWLRVGQAVVVDKNGVAKWVYEYGNTILQPTEKKWKPKGEKLCFEEELLPACITEEPNLLKPTPAAVVPTPKPKATEKKVPVVPRTKPVPTPTPKPIEKKAVVVKPTPVPQATPAPKVLINPEEWKSVVVVQDTRREVEQRQPQYVVVFRDKERAEEYRPPERPQYLPAVQTQVNDQKVFVSQPTSQKKKKDYGTLVICGVVVTVGAAVIGAILMTDNDRKHRNSPSPDPGGGPAPDPPN